MYVYKWSTKTPEAVCRRYAVKRLFLKILKNSQENTSVFFNKVADLGLQLYQKRDSDICIFLLVLRNF